MRHSHCAALLLVLALPAQLAAQAQSVSSEPAPSRWRGALHFGIEHGGDRVVQFEYEDGSTPSVIAGGGLLLLGGASFTAWAAKGHAIEVQGQTGIKWRTIPPATNQSANWLRIPVEGLVFWRTPNSIRLGAGTTMHINNALKTSGEVLDGELGFAKSTGAVVQAEYARRNYAFDVRYTRLTYTINKGGSGTLGASSIGAGMTLFLSSKKAARLR